jgi:hypothetical protein
MHIRIFILATLAMGLLLPFSGHSQGLTMIRVLNVSKVEDTVPAGMAWKITGLLTHFHSQSSDLDQCGSMTGNRSRRIFINGNPYFIQGSISRSGDFDEANISGSSLPFWLPEGSRVRTECRGSLLSIVEYGPIDPGGEK